MGCSSDERKIVYFAQKTVEVCSGIALHWLKYVFVFFSNIPKKVQSIFIVSAA